VDQFFTEEIRIGDLSPRMHLPVSRLGPRRGDEYSGKRLYFSVKPLLLHFPIFSDRASRCTRSAGGGVSGGIFWSNKEGDGGCSRQPNGRIMRPQSRFNCLLQHGQRRVGVLAPSLKVTFFLRTDTANYRCDVSAFTGHLHGSQWERVRVCVAH
jgi:hypothetical protein